MATPSDIFSDDAFGERVACGAAKHRGVTGFTTGEGDTHAMAATDVTMKTTSTALPCYTKCYPAVITSVSEVRKHTCAVLRTWSMESIVSDTLVVISELATNAVRHCRGENFSVSALRLENGVRVTVADTCTTIPVLHPVSDDAEGGRGMFLVDALASRWGIELDTHRKQVWAELSC